MLFSNYACIVQLVHSHTRLHATKKYEVRSYKPLQQMRIREFQASFKQSTMYITGLNRNSKYSVSCAKDFTFVTLYAAGIVFFSIGFRTAYYISITVIYFNFKKRHKLYSQNGCNLTGQPGGTLGHKTDCQDSHHIIIKYRN